MAFVVGNLLFALIQRRQKKSPKRPKCSPESKISAWDVNGKNLNGNFMKGTEIFAVVTVNTCLGKDWIETSLRRLLCAFAV